MQLPDKRALLARVAPRRAAWNPDFRPTHVESVGAGEESVWDYPRPPVIVPACASIRVLCGEYVVAETDAALLIEETAGAPVPYLPPGDVRSEWLAPDGTVSVCEWKGAGVGHDLVLPSGRRIADAAWCYPDPFDDLGQGYAAIAGWFAFYPAKLACFVRRPGAGDHWERVRPQPGGYYGGWVTDRIRGPIKGARGTERW